MENIKNTTPSFNPRLTKGGGYTPFKDYFPAR